jgi:hypothetical protein
VQGTVNVTCLNTAALRPGDRLPRESARCDTADDRLPALLPYIPQTGEFQSRISTHIETSVRCIGLSA